MSDFPSGRAHRDVPTGDRPVSDVPARRGGADASVQPGGDHTGHSGVGERLGIRDMRRRLTALVRRAGTGERIVITIAGRPVAQLGPVEATSAQPTIDDLVARGLLEAAHRADRPPPDLRVDSWTGGRLDRALREVRGA